MPLAPEKQKRLADRAASPQDIVLGIRPEHVILREDGFTGTVEVTEMMGSNLHLHVRFGDDEAVILVPDDEEQDSSLAPGQTVRFTFSDDRMHLFSKETELNLEH